MIHIKRRGCFCSHVSPNPISAIDLITLVAASARGICAIYLCHHPTSQLHSLVPDGREGRESGATKLAEQKAGVSPTIAKPDRAILHSSGRFSLRDSMKGWPCWMQQVML